MNTQGSKCYNKMKEPVVYYVYRIPPYNTAFCDDWVESLIVDGLITKVLGGLNGEEALRS